MTKPPSSGPAPAKGKGDPAATATGPATGSAQADGLRTTFAPTLLVALAALAAVAPLAMDAYLPAFSRMSADLGVSASTTQLTLTMFLVGVALGQLSIGVLSDRFGRRPLLLWGSVLAFVAGAGAALAPGAGLLLVARFFQGLGGAAGMVLGRAVISDRSRGITTARALSLVMAIQGIAPVVAPILGGALVGPAGWRGILAVVAAFQGLLVIAVALWVPETLPASGRHDGGLGVLVEGTAALSKDRVFVRVIVINALVYALLTAYLSAAPFILQGILGMATAAYTAVFAVVCAGALDGPVGADSRALLTAITVSLFIAHVVGLGTCIGNLPAIALGRTGRWAGTGSALLGFVQFVFGGLASPLVGLSGATSGVAFGIVIVVLGAVANALAVFGLRDRGERERVKAERAAARSRRLGRDQL